MFNHQITVVVDDHILWFQIPVDDVVGVEVLEHQDCLGSVKDALLEGQKADVTERVKEFQSVDEFSKDKNRFLVPKAALVLHNKRIV